MELPGAKKISNSSSLRVVWWSNWGAMKQLLQDQILMAIALLGGDITATELSLPALLTLQRIPQQALAGDTGFMYRCAIALQLAPLWKLPALDIAYQIMASLSTLSQDTGKIVLDLSVEVIDPGWINLRLSDRTLATWLQHLSTDLLDLPVLRSDSVNGSLSEISGGRHKLPPSPPQPTQSSKNLFLVQYAHARCCSLLRLAHQQGLIQLRDLEFKTPSGQFLKPNPIPWLNDDYGVTKPMGLRLGRPAERSLIAQILNGVDQMINPSHRQGLKLASALSNGFESFYSSCRIWGEVNPTLAQARLGLVGVTQVLLRSLLQDQLGFPAPVEL